LRHVLASSGADKSATVRSEERKGCDNGGTVAANRNRWQVSGNAILGAGP